jgi:fimbrial chaperone protein
MLSFHDFRASALGIAVLMSALVASGPAGAMSVSPASLDMTTTGNNKGQITVGNDSAKPLPVEILIKRIELSESGELISKPAGDEFLIFPPQALLASGATQTFRVQWVGDPAIRQSQNFIFSVNQVPVKMPASTSGVQVVFNFSTFVNVAPPGGQAAINLVNATVSKDDKGKPRPALTVKNPGNVYARLTDATIRLSGGSWSETLRPEQLRQAMGVGLIQPGKTRRFLLPVDLPPGVGQVTASIEYKPAR